MYCVKCIIICCDKLILSLKKDKENNCVLLVNNLHINVKRYFLFKKNFKKIAIK